MTDSEFLLAVLRERPDQWVAQADIIERSQQERGYGITVHSRASDLRKLGYDVENQVVRGWDGYHRKPVGRAVSYYRLVTLTAAGSPLLSPSRRIPRTPLQ